MQTNGTRIVAALVALAVVVGLFFALKGGDDGDSTTAATETAVTTTAGGDEAADTPPAKLEKKPDGAPVPVIKVAGGEPRGGVAGLEFNKGEDVRFAVVSDTADEVHIHGYDISEDVKAGGKVAFDFPADLDGVFEVELEGAAVQLAELTVNP